MCASFAVDQSERLCVVMEIVVEWFLRRYDIESIRITDHTGMDGLVYRISRNFRNGIGRRVAKSMRNT